MYSTDVRKCIICAIVWIISVTHDMLNYFGTLVENILYEYILTACSEGCDECDISEERNPTCTQCSSRYVSDGNGACVGKQIIYTLIQFL